MAAKRKDLIAWKKTLVWVISLMPVVILLDRIFLAGQFFGGPFVDDPVELIQHWTGTAALIFMFVTLAVTPLRRLTGWNQVVRYRRLVGLFAFFYASLHVFSYFVFDHRMQLESIVEDVIEHNWVLVGFLAWLLLVPLAVTSTTGWIRRLGGKRWNQLHRLVYPVAILGVLHFIWLVKLELTEPLIYAGILAVILGARWWVRK